MEGFLYNTIGKLLGLKPSANDPELCNKCEGDAAVKPEITEEKESAMPEMKSEPEHEKMEMPMAEEKSESETEEASDEDSSEEKDDLIS